MIFLLSVVAIAAVPAREEVSKDFSKKFSLAVGQKVSVENKNGDIAVHGVTGSEASIRAFIRVSANDRSLAEQFANAIVVDVTNGATELRIHVKYPERSGSSGFWERIFGGPNLGYSVRLV